jgi:hypothetical protein
MSQIIRDSSGSADAGMCLLRPASVESDLKTNHNYGLHAATCDLRPATCALPGGELRCVTAWLPHSPPIASALARYIIATI